MMATIGLYLCMAFVGCSLMVSSRDALNTNWPADQQTFRIIVVDSPKSSGKTIQLSGSIEAGRFTGKKVRIVLMEKTGKGKTNSILCKMENIIPGDALILHAKISSPHASGNPCDFDRASWLRRQGISGEAFCFEQNLEKSHTPPSDIPLTAQALRFREGLISQYTENFYGRDLGILSAMTLGHRNGIDKETRQLFSTTGVSHVLALSGLHLGILFSIYNLFVLKRFRNRRAKMCLSLIGIVGIWAFAFTAGLPLSLVRAAGMFSCMQLLWCIRRRTTSVAALSLSALLILLLSPMSLFDVGFQLSCLSVLAILLFAPIIPVPGIVMRHKVLRWCWGLMSVSIIAQIATAPLVAFYFNQLPTYGLLANFLAVPLAYGILFLSFFFFTLPFLQPVLAVPIGWLLDMMDGGLSWVSSLPWSSIQLHPSPLAAATSYLLIFLITTYALSRQPLWIYLSALTLVTGAGTEFYMDRHSEPHGMIVFYNFRTATAIHFIYSPSKSYLWLPDTARSKAPLAYINQTFWQQKGISQPVRLKPNYSDSHIFSTGRIALFNGIKVVLLSNKLPYNAASSESPSKTLDVDYLILARGYNQDLERALCTYHPKKIILDSSLTDYYHEKFRQETLAARLPLHDMDEKGALIVHTNRKTNSD